MDVIEVRPRDRQVISVEHREPLIVRPREREVVVARTVNSFWERSGWAEHPGPRGTYYVGQFRVTDRRTGRPMAFDGRIETGDRLCQAYIHGSAMQFLSRHPKRNCFMDAPLGWRHMNWWMGTSDVDETIAYVEKTLDESVNGFGR